MAIKFGGSDIQSIKYCDANGALHDVTKVVRNGATVWEKTGSSNVSTS